MKNLIYLPILIILCTNIYCQSPDVAYKNLNSEKFKKEIAQNGVSLIDVRTISEFKNQHIKNAQQLNFYALDFRDKLLLLPKDEAIYLYCNTGFRSEIAAKYLSYKGFKKVYNLEKGIMDWNLKNLPTVSEPDAVKDNKNKMTMGDFKKLIHSDTLVLIDFYAPWCGPCRKMMPMIDSLKIEYHPKIKVVKINADASKKLIKQLNMNTVPYFALYKKDELLFHKRGMTSRKELIDEFNKHL